jgi:hypothetical protein
MPKWPILYFNFVGLPCNGEIIIDGLLILIFPFNELLVIDNLTHLKILSQFPHILWTFQGFMLGFVVKIHHFAI